jgi:hypothetical protein
VCVSGTWVSVFISPVRFSSALTQVGIDVELKINTLTLFHILPRFFFLPTTTLASVVTLSLKAQSCFSALHSF